MKKVIIIAGMGPGLGFGVAQKFGHEGYAIGMISRDNEKLNIYKNQLLAEGIQSDFVVADLSKTEELIEALNNLKTSLGSISILHYNAVDYRMKHILDENVEDLTNGFKISIGNAFAATMELLPDLITNEGSVLFTGGGSATHPSVDMASISLGKAGIRNLALQLHEALKPKNVFAGTVTINGWINPESTTHSPTILASKFWELSNERSRAEFIY